MDQLQHEPSSVSDLQASYDELYQGWMREHKNIEQANWMLDLLNVQPGKLLLDIGCGTGYVVQLAEKRGLHAMGIDLSYVGLQVANQQYKSGLADFILAKGEELPYASRSVDYVLNLGSLEHFIDPGMAVRESARVLRSAGRAVFLVPNSHHFRSLYNVWKYGDMLSDLQEFERFATRGEWERLLTRNGFRICSTHRFETGMSRLYRPGREIFWTFYNVLFRLFGFRWIPFNFAYSFIFVCEPSK